MKRILNILACAAAAICLISCNQSASYKTLVPEDLNRSVGMLDTLVMQMGADGECAGTWQDFAAKCRSNDFAGAYRLCKDNEKQIDLFTYLRHPNARFIFHMDVLKPLIYEFESEEKAETVFMQRLETEYAMEANIMQGLQDDLEYIPESFPFLITELGCLLAKNGRLEDALGLTDNFAMAVYNGNGDTVATTFAVTKLVAQFYRCAGEEDMATGKIKSYKQYSADHKADFRSPEEYEYYMNLADAFIR